MKIMHVLQGAIGGAAESVTLLSLQLRKQGHASVVVCPKDSELQKKCFNHEIECVTLDMCREISFIKDFISLYGLVKIIKEHKPDILHAHSSKAGAIGRVAAWLLKIPCVYTARGWAFNMRGSKGKKLLYQFIERMLSRITGIITCISQHEVDSAITSGIASHKLVKIDNGIDFTKFHFQESVEQLKDRLQLPKNKIIVGMTGRISEQKNPLFFVDIAYALLQRNSNCYFVWLGDGELRKSLEEKILSRNLSDHFLITGWKHQPELYMKCFDVGLLTSKWEGFGLVLVEYMACSVPIVASNVDGIPYVVTDGYSGFLCESGSVEQFVEKICSLLRDKSLVDEITKNAFKEAHGKFSIDRVAEQYYSVYEKLS